MTRSRRLSASLPAACAALALLAALPACTPPTDNLGNRYLKQDVAAIQVGRSSKNEITRLLGSPSSTAPLDDNTWYYINARQVQWAFLKPTTREQNVLVLRFDQGGILQEMKELDLKDAQAATYVDRRTPTRGGEPGIILSLYDTIMRGPVGGARKTADKRRGPEY